MKNSVTDGGYMGYDDLRDEANDYFNEEIEIDDERVLREDHPIEI